MQPAPVFNFRVFFAPAPPATGTFGTTDVLIAAAGLAASAIVNPRGIGFAEVSGINAEIEVEEYREGGRNFSAHRFPKWGRFPNLVFRHGTTNDPFLWNWWLDVISRSYTLALPAAIRPERRNGVILLEGVDHKPVAGWFFANGLPERLIGPSLNARASETAIDTLEISHEGLLRLPLTNLPASL